jgi:Alternative complex III, ActD subunit
VSGLVAAFATETAIEQALDRLRVDPPGRIETYTPTALTEDKKGTGSPLPLIIFIAGMLGAAATYALETYSDVVNWPVNVGGRPPFSWPAFVPVAFEMGILWAISAGFFGYLIAGRLSRLWEPVDECAAMREAMRDQWVVAVYSKEHADLARARRILEKFQPLSIEYISPELEEVPA